jgi:hypothetical protein
VGSYFILILRGIETNVGWFQVVDQELLGDQTWRISILLKRGQQIGHWWYEALRLMLVLQLELKLDHTDVHCLDQNQIFLYIRWLSSLHTQ